jgi:hypothetical protein
MVCRGNPLYSIDEIFDLKGSSINRHAKKKRAAPKRNTAAAFKHRPTPSSSALNSLSTNSAAASAPATHYNTNPNANAGGSSGYVAMLDTPDRVPSASTSASASAGIAVSVSVVQEEGISDEKEDVVIVPSPSLSAAASASAGGREKPVILKDNDLKKTVRVSRERALFFIEQVTAQHSSPFPLPSAVWGAHFFGVVSWCGVVCVCS